MTTTQQAPVEGEYIDRARQNGSRFDDGTMTDYADPKRAGLFLYLSAQQAPQGGSYANALYVCAQLMQNMDAELTALRQPQGARLTEEEREGVDNATYLEALAALEDLSLECFVPFATTDGRAQAPTVATYNRTYDVLERHLKNMNVSTVKSALASRSKS